jgi:hypothetical protein
LQGAQGLSALRVTANLEATRPLQQPLPEIATAAVQALPQRASAAAGKKPRPLRKSQAG